jgi:hypothetical protein
MPVSYNVSGIVRSFLFVLKHTIIFMCFCIELFRISHSFY